MSSQERITRAPWRRLAAVCSDESGARCSIRRSRPERRAAQGGAAKRELVQVCAVCPVRDECLRARGRHDERYGIWGGMTDRERRSRRHLRQPTGRRGPAIRTSSRRRVIPRLSSSVTSGRTYLRLAPVTSRNCATVKPSGDAASRLGGDRRRGVDRLRVEDHTVALHDVAAPRQLADVVAIDDRRQAGGSETTVEQLVEERVVDVRVDRVGREHETGIDHDRRRSTRSPPAHARRTRRGRRRSEPASATRATTAPRTVAASASGVVTQSPTVGSTVSPVSCSSSSTRHPAALAHHSIDRRDPAPPARPRSTGSMSRISPPPTVSSRPDSRRMNRSPGSNGSAGREEQANRTGRRRARGLPSPSTRILTGCSPAPMYATYAPRRDTS